MKGSIQCRLNRFLLVIGILSLSVLVSSTVFSQQKMPIDPARDAGAFREPSGFYGIGNNELAPVLTSPKNSKESYGSSVLQNIPDTQVVPPVPRAPQQVFPEKAPSPVVGNVYTWPNAGTAVNPCKDFKGKEEDVRSVGAFLATLLAGRGKAVDNFKENTPTGCLGVQWKYYISVLEAFGKGAI